MLARFSGPYTIPQGYRRCQGTRNGNENRRWIIAGAKLKVNCLRPGGERSRSKAKQGEEAARPPALGNPPASPPGRAGRAGGGGRAAARARKRAAPVIAVARRGTARRFPPRPILPDPGSRVAWVAPSCSNSRAPFIPGNRSIIFRRGWFWCQRFFRVLL